MLDNLTILDIDALTKDQWALACRVLNMAFGEDVSEKQLDNVPIGKLPSSLEEGLRHAVHDIRIDQAFEAEDDRLFYITLEQVPRDLDEVLEKELLADGLAILAKQENYTDAGHGESEALYACEGFGIHLHTWMPEYCDDEYDATTMVSLDMRPQEQRRDSETQHVASINDAIVRRVEQSMRSPAVQRTALAKRLRELADKLEVTTVEDEPCPA